VFLSLCVCVYVFVEVEYVHMSADGSDGRKSSLDPLRLELQVDVSHLAWVLGSKLQSLPRAMHILPPPPRHTHTHTHTHTRTHSQPPNCTEAHL